MVQNYQVSSKESLVWYEVLGPQKTTGTSKMMSSVQSPTTCLISCDSRTAGKCLLNNSPDQWLTQAFALGTSVRVHLVYSWNRSFTTTGSASLSMEIPCSWKYHVHGNTMFMEIPCSWKIMFMEIPWCLSRFVRVILAQGPSLPSLHRSNFSSFCSKTLFCLFHLISTIKLTALRSVAFSAECCKLRDFRRRMIALCVG
jgi:hypothetical protein